MPTTDESVIESGSQTGNEEVEQRSPEQDQGAEQVERQERENRIPHSRVEEMIAQRLEKARREWEEKDLNPLRKTQQDMVRQFQEAEMARLRALGIYKDEEPKPVTASDLEKQMKALRDEYQESLKQFYHGQRIRDGFAYVESKYPDMLKFPHFANMLVAAYSQDPNKTIQQHADEFHKHFIGLQKAARKAEQDERNQLDRRVVPAGRGSAPGASQQGKKRQTVGQKLLAKLREQDSDE